MDCCTGSLLLFLCKVTERVLTLRHPHTQKLWKKTEESLENTNM